MSASLSSRATYRPIVDLPVRSRQRSPGRGSPWSAPCSNHGPLVGDVDRGDAMSTVVMHAVTSVDGYIADENDEVGPLFDWYFNGTEPLVDEPAEQLHSPF